MPSRALLAFAAAAAALCFAAETQAAPCRDAKGHFTACPAPAAAKTAERCRDAKGHFTACSVVASRTTVSPPAAAPAPLPAPRASMARVTPAPVGRAANTVTVAPGAATARCRDGTLSYSKHRSGTCASHGGVAQWM